MWSISPAMEGARRPWSQALSISLIGAGSALLSDTADTHGLFASLGLPTVPSALALTGDLTVVEIGRRTEGLLLFPDSREEDTSPTQPERSGRMEQGGKKLKPFALHAISLWSLNFNYNFNL